MSKNSNSNQDSEILDEYDFSQGVRGKYFLRYQSEDKRKSLYESVGGLIVAGASAILSAFPLTAPIGAAGSFGLWVWQKEQQKKFNDELEPRLESLDKSKLDQAALDSDEFKSLVLQAVETASSTASDLKRQALANALVNSVISPTSSFTGKQALLRILSQLSDEEMVALTVLYDEEPRVAAETTKNYISSVREADVATKLKWTEEEARIACEGLFQLGLVYDPLIGAVVADGRGDWRITALALKLIKWCSETTA